MPKQIFLSYAGRTVKAEFDGSSVDELAACFASKFPNSAAKFVFYVTDKATGVEYEVSDISDVAEGTQVCVKLCDESGGARRYSLFAKPLASSAGN